MYAIWARFPTLVRRRVLARTYRKYTKWEGMPRCAMGRCPLGVALTAMGEISFAPPALRVANRFAPSRSAVHSAVLEEARVFIVAWDAGTITNLPDALGLRRARS
jgi:hypothetical protein